MKNWKKIKNKDMPPARVVALDQQVQKELTNKVYRDRYDPQDYEIWEEDGGCTVALILANNRNKPGQLEPGAVLKKKFRADTWGEALRVKDEYLELKRVFEKFQRMNGSYK